MNPADPDLVAGTLFFKHPPLSNMLLSLAQKVGCETEKFSDATGTLEGLVSSRPEHGDPAGEQCV